MNAASNSTVEELVSKVVDMNKLEDEVTTLIGAADGMYSEGKMTLSDWEELTDPLFEARGELRLMMLKAQEELDEVIPSLFIDEVAAWELKKQEA